MNSSDYTFLLNKPAAVTDRQTEALEKIVSEFPYFQSARALRLKGLYNQNSFQYNFALKVAAAHTTDRSVLFDFITSDTFTAIHKGLYDQKIAELHNVEVKGSEVVVEENVESAPAVDLVEASILSSIKESESAETELPKSETIENTVEPEVETVLEVSEQEMISKEESSVSELMQQIPETDALEEIEFVTTDEIRTQSETFEIPETAIETVEETNQNPVESSEAKLHIGEPLEFSKTETHSFQEWLQLSRVQPIVREEDPEKPEPTEPDPVNPPDPRPDVPIVTGSEPEIPKSELDKIKKSELIDRFIENNPKIPQMKADAEPAEIPEQKEVHSSLMTETLARVYLEQKKYQKAIQAYEILILKYPEKSSFFADRISEIKILQQNT